MKEVQLTWAAWHGDRPLTITFPLSWDIKVVENTRPMPLSQDDIYDKICHPVGSPALFELAKGKNTAAILIDDMTRPTPTHVLLPFIVKELEAGGIPRSKITVIIAGGTHRGKVEDHISKKIGSALANDVNIIMHNCEENLTYLGITKKGTPIYVNTTFLESDLRIGVGSILPHPIAGFSGGSKIVVPGICGSATISYLHDYAQCYHHDDHSGPGKRIGIVENAFRQEIDTICDAIGLDFLVNVAIGQSREILDVFAGNWKEVYKLGTMKVRELFKVKPVRADVIVSNAYPLDTDIRYMFRGLWPLFDKHHKTTKVVIGFGGDGLGALGSKAKSGSLISRLLKRLKQVKPGQLRNEISIGISILRKIIQKRTMEYLVFCPTVNNRELNTLFRKSICFDNWGDVLAEIERRNPNKDITVAVYPYAPLQFP